MEQLPNREAAESAAGIKAFVYMLWSWAWLVALAGGLAGASALVVSMHTTPIYEAATRILLSAPSQIGGVDPSALVTTQTMTDTYSQMLLERPVLQGVIEQLKLPMPTDDFKKVKESITVSTVPNTQLLVITVQDPDPQRAADIANALASVFAARIRELQAARFAASREGLATQVADMEQQVASTTSQIAAIQKQIDAAATQTAVAATAKGAGTAAATAGPPAATPDAAALLQLQARLTQYRTIYSSLVTSFEQVRLSEEQTSTNVVVSEPAVVGTVPVKPKTALNTALGVLAGMLLAMGAVFAIETLDDTIKNPEEIRRKFGLPILGIIARHDTADDVPIALSQPRSPTAEAFRALRTNVTFAAVDRPLRRLMVTSASPEDGKTIIACGLAVVLAQGERQVVLIDADMRRPEVHPKFGLQNRTGLSGLFVQPLEAISSMLQATTLPKLKVLTSGGLPPNPSELLTSKMMGRILDKLDQACDIMVVDTPPLVTVTDAAALAPAMDGVLLVAKPGSTKVGAFQQAIEQLRAVNARVLGVVMNQVNPSSRKYGYYFNRYYSKDSRYYELGAETDKKKRKIDKASEAAKGKNRRAAD